MALTEKKILGRVSSGTGDVEDITLVISIGTPGTDTQIPTEKAVRDSIDALSEVIDGNSDDNDDNIIIDGGGD
jgi:hypothetical protein